MDRSPPSPQQQAERRKEQQPPRPALARGSLALQQGRRHHVPNHLVQSSNADGPLASLKCRSSCSAGRSITARKLIVQRLPLRKAPNLDTLLSRLHCPKHGSQEEGGRCGGRGGWGGSSSGSRRGRWTLYQLRHQPARAPRAGPLASCVRHGHELACECCRTGPGAGGRLLVA